MLPLVERDAVREQMERILASHYFRNSKRFRDFLRCTVEHALNGSTEDVKERTLGIEVFGREPDYDTSLDPVVRVSAAEVRKRLAQYYQLPGHKHEARIEYPLRSYVPEFVFPKNDDGPAAPVVPPPVAVPQGREFRPKRWELLFAILFSCVVVSAFILWKLPVRETALDRYWEPIQAGGASILLCISDTNSPTAPALNPPPPDAVTTTVASLPTWYRRNHVAYPDTFALTVLAGFLGTKGRTFRVRRADDANLQDLQEGPVILIGGRNNPWSVRLDNGRRFSFIRDGNLRYISDRDNPLDKQWSVQGTARDPGVATTQDYALISRIFDPTTGRPLVTAAGILGYGTEAAAECLTDNTCLAQADEMAKSDWKHKNFQIVIGTAVIGEDPGKPRVLAAYAW
jgi:hypothetical protein